MYVEVRLLNGFPEPLLYKIPATWNFSTPLLHAIVKVPLKQTLVSGLVIKVLDQLPSTVTFAIRPAHSYEVFPCDPHYIEYLKKLCGYYQIEMSHVVARIKHFLTEDHITDHADNKHADSAGPESITLTSEQQTVVNFGYTCLETKSFAPILMHGVTGSGKTEVYKKLIERAYQQGKTTVLLLPEVTLALQFEHVLKKQLPHIPLYGFHSGTSSKDKKQLWSLLLAEKPVLLVGVHLPVLLPIANLGMIIVDEEHEQGYQEKKHPKINSKEAALIRAHIAQIPILLGSATPSVSSLYNVKHKGWHFFQLKQRFSGNFPNITTVLLPEQQYRKQYWISKELEKAIAQRLAAKEQVIIFLNRRGYSFFVQCKKCTFIFSCTQCSVSLTLHQDNSLTCHYCGKTKKLPTTCPQCTAPETDFLKKGIGTQQVVTILEKLFPQARIARADLDVTAKKKVWQQTVTEFEAGAIDILVGTQTITKGYHFPRVTLVGVIWADLNLHFPVYNAAESCLQQLIQVAGRAGRSTQKSQVIMQTMIDHHIFKYINEIDYLSFYEHEITSRATTGYPPCQRLAQIELKHLSEHRVEQESYQLLEELMYLKNKFQLAVTILGPAKPVVHMIKKTHSRALYLKGADITHLAKLYEQCNKSWYKSSLFFIPNPLH
ncbi:hypothetical protein Noda2021_00540 [Candidatus Dependentiae bacterium Noda2021]|nr:hypothetical protein Noda2021_00540 [Candidatus Dependentiae bacterium Noda2021]